ncbi:hypothetical protein H1P_760007 [Hyella patelloides LEGE 07179]|uniref:Uncharacterized protein n=1 Tax=Hyella patelloides LEGE 07179 TaxID=945734 RepID=A0A563W3S5_9CYAN|nr:hypothetical protein H1P_760007 [Hyella patelloides LEGE 07179]
MPNLPFNCIYLTMLMGKNFKPAPRRDMLETQYITSLRDQCLWDCLIIGFGINF